MHTCQNHAWPTNYVIAVSSGPYGCRDIYSCDNCPAIKIIWQNQLGKFMEKVIELGDQLNVGTETCNALSPTGGNRCALSKGHSGDIHHNGHDTAAWYGDYTYDPAARKSEIDAHISHHEE